MRAQDGYTKDDFARRRPARHMTPRARVAEMRRLGGDNVHLSLADFLTRVDELVGRPVYTHEIGLAWDDLVAEAATWTHPAAQEIVARAQRSGKPVIVVQVQDKTDGPSPS